MTSSLQLVPSSEPINLPIITHSLRSLHWLKNKEQIRLSLRPTYKVTTTEPSYLYDLISLQPHRSTRSCECCHRCSSIFVFLFESQQPLFPPCITCLLVSGFWNELPGTSPTCRWWVTVTVISSFTSSSSSLSLCITPSLFENLPFL